MNKKDLIKKLILEGKTYIEIAKIMGFNSKTSVYYHLHKIKKPKKNKYSIKHFRGRERGKAYRDNMRKYICEVCGKTDCELYLHHIVPIMLAGRSTERNCITLCNECHSEVHNKINKVLLKYFEDKQDELYEVLRGTITR